MRVAVTGASGYVGRALVQRLIQLGHDVTGLLRSTPRAPVDSRMRVARGDVRDAAALRELVVGADAIAHAAAYVHRAADSPPSRAECFAVNDAATRLLVEAASATGRTPHVVLVSTTGVYGSTFRDVAEDATPRPVTAYGQSKLAAERHVLDAARAGSITGCVLRPAVVYGVGAPGNTQRLVDLVRRGRAIPRVRGGLNRKSMVHVDDTADAIARALESREVHSRTFNVAGDPVSVADLVEAIAEGVGVKVQWMSVPAWAVDSMAWASRMASKATAGRFPDLARSAEAFVGEASVDAKAITRDLGVSFRHTLPAAREMAKAMAAEPRFSTRPR